MRFVEEKYRKIICKRSFGFYSKNPTSFYVTQSSAELRLTAGFTQISEKEELSLTTGGKYFTVRNGSALIAFVLTQNLSEFFLICASHADSPCFKVKESPDIHSLPIARVNIEKYGEASLLSWFDRSLSLAGRLTVSSLRDEKVFVRQLLLDFKTVFL